MGQILRLFCDKAEKGKSDAKNNKTMNRLKTFGNLKKQGKIVAWKRGGFLAISAFSFGSWGFELVRGHGGEGPPDPFHLGLSESLQVLLQDF
mgnify:FL=1